MYLLGVVTGYVVSGLAVLLTFSLGTVAGVLLVCMLGARQEDRCADLGCVRRVR